MIFHPPIRPEAALRSAGEILLEDSRAACPVDSGNLRNSGYVSQSGDTVRVGYAAPYAAIVHERQNKFLGNSAQSPAVHEAMLAAMANAIRF